MTTKLVEGKKYIMTEADGSTQKEVIYKGSRYNTIKRMHKLYVINDETEVEVPDMILQLMNLKSVE